MREGPLSRGDVFGLAFPRRLRRVLKRTTVGEGKVPRQISDFVHGVEVGGRLLVALSAGEESDARHRAWYAILEDLDRLLGHFLDAGSFAVFLSGSHHARLSSDRFVRAPLEITLPA